MKPLLEAGKSLEVAYATNAVHLDYLHHIKGIDENIGRLLGTLDQLKLAEDTVVVYTSDNGFYLGEHGLGDKRALYEEGLRIPFIIRYPRHFPKGGLVDEMIINQDLAPTFLDLAGLPAHPGMHGVSFKPLALGNKPADWRTSFLAYYRKELGDTPTCRGIRTENAKLIVYKNKPEWTEVYDLKNDPYESWWGALHAIEALVHANKPELIAKHRDLLLEFIKYDCTWLKTAAVVALAKIANDPEHYKIVLPVIVDQAASFRVESSTTRTSAAIAEAMKNASPDVKAFASPLMQKTFAAIPSVIKEPNTGALMSSASTTIRSRFGSILQLLPDGEEFVKILPRTTLKSFLSGKDSDKYAYSGKFTPNKELMGKWAWCIYPQPSNPSEVEPYIQSWVKPKNGPAPSQILENPKDTLEFLPDGKIGKSNYFRGCFWSGDMMIPLHEDQALKMELRTIGGRDFLIIERGGFNTPPTSDDEVKIPKDWHCGYHVYVRQ